MQGYLVKFYTLEDRQHAHQPLHEWLMQTLASRGIKGATSTMADSSFGRSGKLHSKEFIELADQPIEIATAMTQAEFDAVFELLEREQANVFYVKSAVEYGVLGSEPPSNGP